MVLPHDDAGAGRALVLLHAGIADRRMWREQLGPLSEEGFRVVAPDLPGFGDAPVAELEDAPWQDVLETLAALGTERATLVGNSFGGLVALAAAVVAPAVVEALVLVSSPAPGVEPTAELEAAWAAEETALERGDLDAAVEAVLDAWLPERAPAEMRRQIGAMQRRAFELQGGDREAEEAEFPLDDELAALAGLTAPALVAVGEHDMRDFHLAADALCAALPHARRVTIAGARHLAPLEAPQAFRAELLSFLAP
jgi:pimeloyl-ACP methyl ester carboxylesterase